ncbi:sigma 54-interacting transcriptional regulator [Fusibacter paucivorans]|uniref:Sigma 54-interacting transcriptional regulator n=1 Tax=Fusibacter paucivorans TaxID=76009 RepID=A0ABS5PPX4_9FIRM|nr:sigma 54-interacting transcriptional regulator [Fusibacter paucivorans]MBS7526957.1 sigma 54-interacting transcriptional regulator [Fusibacter paucivorans]
MHDAALYKMMLDTMAFGIFVTDQNGSVAYVNQSMLDLVDLDKAAFMALDFDEMYRQGLIKRNITKRVRESKKPMFLSNTYYTDEGKGHKIIGFSSPIFDEHGNVLYVMSMTMGHLQELLLSVWMEGESVERESEQMTDQSLELIYESTSMKRLVAQAKRVSKVDTAVLITGESGTGKSVLARYIHNDSRFGGNELVEVNCAAFPETLLESMLFGYEKGAFTGALATGKPGMIEAAENGTLFLDEIDSLSLNLQGKLLKVLEEKKVQRIGSLKSRAINFRLITATNAVLEEKVMEKAFRADLYYRINVLPLTIPPLRERPEDIRVLSKYFLAMFCKRYDKIKLLTPTAYKDLTAYHWPGNVRELKNFIERLVIMSDNEKVEFLYFPELFLNDGDMQENENHLFNAQTFKARDFSLKTSVDNYEKALLSFVLSQYGLSKAAEILKVDPSTITRKRHKYGID